MVGLGMGMGIGHSPRKGGGAVAGPTWAEFVAGLTETQVLDIDFSQLDRHFQNTTGQTLADDAGENIALALDDASTDGRGVVNRLLYSNAFDNAAWTKSTLTASPSGDAFKIVNDNAQANGSVYQSAPFAAAKNIVALFNVATGTFVSNTVGAFDSYTITALADSWYRISVVLDSQVATAEFKAVEWNRVSIQSFFGSIRYYPKDSVAATGDGTSGILIRKAQVEAGTAATAYQENRATVGGPGNHGLQASATLQGKRQAGGVCRYDGIDDNHLTTFLAQNGAMTLLYHGTIDATISATQMFLGASGSGANRCWLAVTTSGFIGAGVGSESTSTIVGTTDVRGKTVVAALTFDGSTVTLFLRVDGATTTEYSAAQASTPTTSIPFRIGSYNNNGTAAGFAKVDAKRLRAAHKGMTLAEFTSIAAALAA